MKSNLVSGVRDYLDRLRSFEVDARLFLYSESAYRFGRTIFRTLFNLYLLSMGYSMAFIGVFNSVRVLARAAGSIPSGVLGNKVGLRNALIAGDVAITLSAGVQILDMGPAVLLLAAGLEGFGVAFRIVNRPAFMTQRSTDEQRNYLFSIRSVVNNVIGMIGSGLGGFIPVMIAVQMGMQIGSPSSYRWTLFLSLFVMIAGASILLFIEQYEDESAKEAARSPLANIKKALKEKSLRPMLLAETLMGFGVGLYIPILNAYLSEYLGATSDQVGMIFSLRRLAGAVTVLFAPVLAANIGKIKTMVSLQLGCSPFIAWLGLTNSLTAAAIIMPVRRSLMSMSGPIRRAFTMEVFHPERRVSAYSLVRTSTGIARGLATTLGAVMMESIHTSSPFLLASIAYAASALVIWREFSDGDYKTYGSTMKDSSGKSQVAD